MILGQVASVRRGDRSGEAEPDRFAAARAVADAVLYEGIVLYPSRRAPRRDQYRWQFGALMPRPYAEAHASERWAARTECLAAAGSGATISARLRALQVQRRTIEAADPTIEGYISVPRLDVEGVSWVACDEAFEASIDLEPESLEQLAGGGLTRSFELDAWSEAEVIRRPDGAAAGQIVRHRDSLSGLVAISASPVPRSPGLTRITVRIENTTPWPEPGEAGRVTRCQALSRSLVAIHVMLAVDDGRFVSLLDPPPMAAEAAAICRSEVTYPVLVGESDDVVLASPIILYDHPHVAPQQTGGDPPNGEVDPPQQGGRSDGPSGIGSHGERPPDPRSQPGPTARIRLLR